MNAFPRLAVWFGLIAFGSATLAGCGESGPPLGEVTGVVTLDGKPLPQAKVEFQPTASNGAPSWAITDDAGKYTLQYSLERQGAMVGEHQVRVTTHRQLSTEEGGGEIPEQVPPKYNWKTELVEKVDKGENTINLDLQSK